MKQIIAILLVLVSACFVPSVFGQQESQDLPRLAVNGKCMGPIPFSVLVVDPPTDIDQSMLQQSVQRELDGINALMSTYVPDSDVSRFNQSPSTDWIEVSGETARVVERALSISKASDGAFDITVGPAVNLWKFGPDKSEFAVPDKSAIEAVAQRVGFQKLEVRMDPPAIRKRVAELQIDLSAIAKGYAVDRVAMLLEDLDCSNYLVEVGGEVRASGHRQNRGMWRVGVEKPDEYRSIPDVVAQLDDASMATSGDYRNYYRVGKKRYSHTIDPTTSQPVNHDLASACIITTDCMTADALATATMVLGLERGEKFLQQQGVEYFLVERNSDFGKQLTRVASSGFPFVGGQRPERYFVECAGR